MIEDLFTELNSALYGNAYLSILSSFTWGILSVILSPCHLSGIPLVIGYISSRGSISVRNTFYLSMTFAFGILITIALIGLITWLFGRLMGDIGTIGNYLVAGVFFIMGLYLLDIIQLPWNGIRLRAEKIKGLSAALVLGLLFGIGLGPCTFAFMAPVLGLVFQSAGTGLILPAALLASFAIGHCIVIAGAGTLGRAVQIYLNWSDKSKLMLYTRKICGLLVIAGGIYILFNQ